MYAATSATPGSTSPTRPASVRLMPTSTTTPPVFTMSGVTIAGTPTAATSTSASSVWRGRSLRVRVADRDGRVLPAAGDAPSACRRSSLRPITTARAPSSSILCSAQELHHAERRRTDERRAAEEELAGVERMQPVDVLRRGDRRGSPCASSMCAGSGSWTRIASTCVVGVQRRDPGEQIVLASSLRAAGCRGRRSRPRARPCA